MDKEKLNKDLEKLMTPTIVKSNLIKASMYLSAFELLKYAVVERLKDFMCLDEGFKDDTIFELKESKKYKSEIANKRIPELDNNKNIYYSSCLWLKKSEIINTEEFDKLQEIRIHRNEIGHQLPKLMIDSNYDIRLDLFESIKTLIKKIERWWIVEFEMPLNSTYDNVDPKDIDYDGIKSGNYVLLEHLVDIVKEDM